MEYQTEVGNLSLKVSEVSIILRTLSKAAATQFGSGWAWLCVNDGKPNTWFTANQDNPIMENGWNSDFRNRCLGARIIFKLSKQKPDYINAFFNIINWDEVNRRYLVIIIFF